MAVVNPARAERIIQGDSTPESAWQRWVADIERAPAGWPDAQAPGARLVVIAPHPDDELLACGGLLCDWTAAGGDALVVAVTDGEASHAGSAGWPATRLAPARRAERTEGLRQLAGPGIRVHRLGLPDGRVADHAIHLPQRLASLLRPADVVVSTWRLDGHPDHDASGHAAAQACSALGCRLLEAPVWMWHWACPGDARVPWQRLRARPLDATTLRRKQAALAAHATQLAPREHGQGPVLDAAILARAARHTECFFV